MNTYNDEVSEKLNALMEESFAFELECHRELEKAFISLQENIQDADYVSFQIDGFDTLKMLIKSKRKLVKASPGSKAVNFLIHLINELRLLLIEIDSVTASIFGRLSGSRCTWILSPVLSNLLCKFRRVIKLLNKR